MTAVDDPATVVASGPVIPVMRPWLGDDEAAAAAEAVRSGWVAQGPRVAEFEAAFARRVHAPHAVAVSSCTTALHLALVLAGVGRGDDVVVPSLSFIATANVVRHVGATPVFADVDLATQNLTPATVEAALTPATRAVILVDQAGLPADIDAVRAVCDPRGIAVVQDAACAAGATWAGEPVGARAELAAFSFHPRKIITTGEGGMLVTDDADRAARARRLREHGMSVSAAERHTARGPVHEQYLETGFNHRMTDIQAAVGLVQLAKLDDIVARRRALGERYRLLLGELPGLGGAVMAGDPPGGTTNYQSFWLCLPPGFPIGRDALLGLLDGHGVSARRGIMAAHLEPAYADAAGRGLPVTERLTRTSLILPLFHEMTESDQDRIIAVLDVASRGTGLMAIVSPGRRLPQVSVIVPCYDYAEYLPRCVGSVLDQHGVDVRVLVIDDCSTDDTPAVAARLAEADPRVEVRRHPVNRGHIATYNEGLAWAEGDCVALVSADDMVTPGAFARATTIMRNDSAVGLVYGRPLLAPSDEPMPTPTGRWRGTTFWDGHCWIGQRCRTGYNCISSPEVVVRTSVHRQVGGYDPELPHSGDLELWLRIAAVSDVAYVRGVPQAIYRVHPRSMLRSRYADPLVDLRHRKAAFDSYFARCGVGPSARDRRAVGRALAGQALWQASRAVDRGRLDDVDVPALVAFADEASPDARRLPQWHGLRARQALGAGRSQWFPPLLVSGAAHRARNEVGNLRWKLRGV